jgi:hypothetical protein
MARNGVGVYSLPQAPFVAGTVISSTAVNSDFSDIANALTQSLAKDGQTVPTANLPMGTYRHTGVGNAVARTEYAAMGQVQDGAGIWCGTAGGTANALTLTPTPAITAYAAGQVFRFTAGASPNSGATTVAVSGLTAQAIQASGAALTSGQIAAGRQYQVVYDGTNFQLSAISAAPGTTASSLVQLDSSARLPAVDGSQLTGVNSGAATITAGENLADRDLIYQDTFNQRGGGADRWYKVDTDATAPVRISPRLGIALAAITSGNTGSAQVRPGRVSGFSGLTAGSPCWASGTAGILTQTEPAIPSSGTQNAVRLVGYAASTTELDFEPDAVTTFVAYNSALASASTLSVQHFTDSGARERIPHAYIAADLFSDTASATLNSGESNNRSTYAYRQLIPAASISTSGTSIKVRLKASTTENLTFTTCRIQEQAGAGNAWDFASAGVTVTFNGGTDGGTVTANSTLTSDAITFALDETKNYIVSFYISGSGANDGVSYRTTQSGWIGYEKVGSAADASATAPSGFSDSGQDVVGVEAILVNAGTRAEPVTIGSETINSAATDRVNFQFSDTSNANADTYTTATNRTGATRALIVEVTL